MSDIKPEEVNKPQELPVVAAEETKVENVNKEVESAPTTTEQEDKQTEEDKTEEPVSPEQEEKEILKQVEFYFSDANLPKDKFLWRTVQSNDEGFVPIETIALFNRMKKYRPLEKVVNAIQKSDFLVVSENGESVRRKVPIVPPNEDEQRDAFQRSIYVKGFPVEEKDWQYALEGFFNTLGQTKQVRLRKDIDRKFKGDVFVEFSTKEEADKVLNMEPKPSFEGHELVIMSKGAFTNFKGVEKKFKNANRGRGRGRGRGSGRGGKRGGSSRGINKNDDTK
ncbi:Lhp1 protein [Saccharomycopsis crataegensis]|uniref:Lhp1 protein n=1 Tax=Saccharomycopsis crataegensis TaxID=43959 RepID=A0AAV5QDF1_9ASCO|nr:Lhp1 protein [Saccharomycopsis crataegensis]